MVSYKDKRSFHVGFRFRFTTLVLCSCPPAHTCHAHNLHFQQTSPVSRACLCARKAPHLNLASFPTQHFPPFYLFLHARMRARHRFPPRLEPTTTRACASMAPVAPVACQPATAPHHTWSAHALPCRQRLAPPRTGHTREVAAAAWCTPRVWHLALHALHALACSHPLHPLHPLHAIRHTCVLVHQERTGRMSRQEARMKQGGGDACMPVAGQHYATPLLASPQATTMT